MEIAHWYFCIIWGCKW